MVKFTLQWTLAIRIWKFVFHERKKPGRLSSPKRRFQAACMIYKNIVLLLLKHNIYKRPIKQAINYLPWTVFGDINSTELICRCHFSLEWWFSSSSPFHNKSILRHLPSNNCSSNCTIILSTDPKARCSMDSIFSLGRAGSNNSECSDFRYPNETVMTTWSAVITCPLSQSICTWSLWYSFQCSFVTLWLKRIDSGGMVQANACTTDSKPSCIR